MKLVWDQTGKHWYENGVSHGVIYPMKDDGTYDNGVAWDGLISVSNNPDGADPNELWADNIKYAVLRSVETLSLTIEAYQYPPEFNKCNGAEEPHSGVFIRQQKRKSFGFVYRTEIGNDTGTDADDHYKLHIVYGCTAQPSDEDYETINDSPDAQTMSWDVDTIPAPCTGHLPVSEIVIDSRTADAVKLTALETTLFGGDSTDPTLPDPDGVLDAMK